MEIMTIVAVAIVSVAVIVSNVSLFKSEEWNLKNSVILSAIPHLSTTGMGEKKDYYLETT